MKIATYNVNGINGRLPVLLDWLAEAKPDVVCLQELKAASDRFPEAALHDAGYEAIWLGQKSWNGVAILARIKPVETRRGLPGDPDPAQSRYIEAAVNGVLIGCLYLPNGNPAPGPKLDYKLAWFEALTRHAADLLASGAPVVLAGDYNVMPTDLDVYKPERFADNALFHPEVRGLQPPAGPGLDRRGAHAPPRDTHLHLLGLSPERLCARRGTAHRSPTTQPSARAPPRGCRGRPQRARAREDQRSRADLDRAGWLGDGLQPMYLTRLRWSDWLPQYRNRTPSESVLSS